MGHVNNNLAIKADLHLHPSLKMYLFGKKLYKNYRTGGAWNPLSEMSRLQSALTQAGFSDDDMAKIMGQNVLRVLKTGWLKP